MNLVSHGALGIVSTIARVLREALTSYIQLRHVISRIQSDCPIGNKSGTAVLVAIEIQVRSDIYPNRGSVYYKPA